MRRLLLTAVLAVVLLVTTAGTAHAFSCFVPDKQPFAGEQGVFTGNVFTGIDLPCAVAAGSSTHGAQQPDPECAS